MQTTIRLPDRRQRIAALGYDYAAQPMRADGRSAICVAGRRS